MKNQILSIPIYYSTVPELPTYKKLVSIMVIYNYKPEIAVIISAIKTGNLDYGIFIDNSTDPATKNEFLWNSIEPSMKDKIIYIKNNYNMGLSKALNLGIKTAIQLSANYVFLLDQDAIPKEDFFATEYVQFQHIFEKDDKVSIIGPIISNCHSDLGKDVGFKKEYSSVVAIINSGMFFNLNLIKKIGYFNEELFLGSVDHDFCSRVIAAGGTIYRINKVLIHQDFGITIPANNIVRKILSLGSTVISLIMMGLGKTNEFKRFAIYYTPYQLNLNLSDANKFQQNRSHNIIRALISRIERIIVVKFGETK